MSSALRPRLLPSVLVSSPSLQGNLETISTEEKSLIQARGSEGARPRLAAILRQPIRVRAYVRASGLILRRPTPMISFEAVILITFVAASL